MKAFLNSTVISFIVLIAGTNAQAQVWPQTLGSMKHVLISFDNIGNSINSKLNDLGPTPPLELRNFGESHNSPADVLDGKWYNDQYGWLPDGFFTGFPAEGAVWIGLVSQTAGLETYEGGMRPMKDMHTYAPIFTTGGSPNIWKMTPNMAHHWMAVDVPGSYEATYNVYVGDATSGAPLAGFTADQITLTWVPEPATASLLAIAGGLLAKRRRRL